MPHDRGALIDQLRAHLTRQRYSSVVIHNYCRGAEYFLEYLARRNIAVDAATPNHVSGYVQYAGRKFRQRHGHPPAPDPARMALAEDRSEHSVASGIGT